MVPRHRQMWIQDRRITNANELDEREMEAQPHRSPFEAMHSPHPLSLAPASPMDGLCDESGEGSERSYASRREPWLLAAGGRSALRRAVGRRCLREKGRGASAPERQDDSTREEVKKNQDWERGTVAQIQLPRPAFFRTRRNQELVWATAEARIFSFNAKKRFQDFILGMLLPYFHGERWHRRSCEMLSVGYGSDGNRSGRSAEHVPAQT